MARTNFKDRARAAARRETGATAGAVENAASFVLVTLAADGAILDRRTLELVEPGMSTHPHHHEGSWAVGRYLKTPGARAITLAQAVELVERVRACAEKRAAQELAALSSAVRQPVVALALRAIPPLPATVEERIRDARAQTFADTAMYRDTLANAARERGWRIHWYERDDVARDAVAALGGEDLDDVLTALGRAIGPPWRAQHRLAATAALAARGPAQRS